MQPSVESSTPPAPPLLGAREALQSQSAQQTIHWTDKLTGIQVVLYSSLDHALVLDAGGMVRELGAVSEIAATIHGLLELGALPAKDVIGVLAEPETAHQCQQGMKS